MKRFQDDLILFIMCIIRTNTLRGVLTCVLAMCQALIGTLVTHLGRDQVN